MKVKTDSDLSVFALESLESHSRCFHSLIVNLLFLFVILLYIVVIEEEKAKGSDCITCCQSEGVNEASKGKFWRESLSVLAT